MESLADTGLATMKRFKLLQEAELESLEDQSREWPKHLFLAQFYRFELWAVNLGVFVMGHGSLDYRIRDSENMKEAISKMMSNLNRSLDEVLAYLHGNIEREEEEEDIDSYSDTESDMNLLLDSIKDPIDRLYKMAVWIRNPATRMPSTKARNVQQVDEQTKVDLFKSFESFDYDHVSSLFLEYEKNKALQENPTAHPHDAVSDYEAFDEEQVWEPIRKTLELNRMKISNGNESYLVRRIARANGLRRQQFAYWKKHRDKLREHATVTVEVPTHNLPTTSQMIQSEDDKNEKFRVPLSVTTATQLRFSYGSGKELENENAMALAVSEYTPSAWNPSKDIVSFPLPPKASTTDGFFECPYCYTICPASILSEKAWRAHLIRDLRPYICTFEHCPNSEQLYDSRDDWIQHETSEHQSVFRYPKSKEDIFATLALSEQRAQKYYNEDAMPSNFAISATTNFYRSCPVCSADLETNQKLQSHIALHLERFAMFSLPRSTGDINKEGPEGQSASVHCHSDRPSKGDLDIASNATSRTENYSMINYLVQERIREMNREVEMLRLQNLQSVNDDQYFLETMAKIRSQLKRYGGTVRAWVPSDTVNDILFQFGEACIGVGLVEEAIEALQHLKLIQNGQLEYDEPAVSRTEQQLALAYQVNEALQEVGKQLGNDIDFHTEPNRSKALDIFARTEAKKRYAETIWGPSIWKTQQESQEDFSAQPKFPHSRPSDVSYGSGKSMNPAVRQTLGDRTKPPSNSNLKRGSGSRSANRYGQGQSNGSSSSSSMSQASSRFSRISQGYDMMEYLKTHHRHETWDWEKKANRDDKKTRL
ncbi:hypothetical protein GGI35DRAFT_436809 [Trichoderma velutinum]